MVCQAYVLHLGRPSHENDGNHENDKNNEGDTRGVLGLLHKKNNRKEAQNTPQKVILQMS